MEAAIAQPGVSRCQWCLAPSDDTTCAACGGPVRLLVPTVVECGWCDASNHRDETATCTHCGGALPSIPGGDPGPCPPPAPREIPRVYQQRIKYGKNVHVIIGIIFTCVFFWTFIFPIIGIPIWIYGRRVAKRRLLALVHGKPTRGRLTSVSIDTSEKINGVHPILLEYEYDTDEGPVAGYSKAWDRTHLDRPVGEHHWVVYVSRVNYNNEPDDRAKPVAELWPPVH